MVCLFVSFVCDTCNPPSNNNNKSDSLVAKPGKDGLYYGYIVFAGDFDYKHSLLLGNKLGKYVYESLEEAKCSYVYLHATKPEIIKVKSRNLLTYTPRALVPGKDAYVFQLIDHKMWASLPVGDRQEKYIALAE
jgi:hypothetical protein